MDNEQLRNTEEYEQIRDEINRRFSLVSGGTNWSRVSKLCEQLADRDGIDLLITIYYSVAATKIRGIAGLADGLELQATVLRQPQASIDIPAKRRVELYRWMLGLIGNDLRALENQPVTLRELYRCDRAIQVIFNRLKEAQPNEMPDIEALGATIFKRIEQLEQKFGTTDKFVIKKKRPEYTLITFILLIGILVGSSLLFVFYKSMADMPALITQLTKKSQTPVPVNLSETEELKIRFSTQQINENQTYLVSLYSDKIENLMLSSGSDKFIEIQQLNNSLHYLYPDDPDVIEQNNIVNNWQQKLSGIMEEQNERFIIARTRAANISRAVQLDKNDELKLLASGLEDYAISLSPLVGRISYIETLINTGKVEQAKEELDILDIRIQALLLKGGELRQQTNKQ
jgi:type VI secretion system protein VasL